LDYDWLIKGDEHSEALPLKQTKSSKTKEGIPLIPVAVMAGFRNGDSQVMDYEIEDNYVVPEFLGKGVKFLIRASGSSMQPKYSNGDILACRPITDLTFFQWGKVYVLDTDQGSVVKRLFPCAEDADAIECHSDNNANYPSFKINKSSIRSISIVVGVIRLE
jgi:repressor LexA